MTKEQLVEILVEVFTERASERQIKLIENHLCNKYGFSKNWFEDKKLFRDIVTLELALMSERNNDELFFMYNLAQKEMSSIINQMKEVEACQN